MGPDYWFVWIKNCEQFKEPIQTFVFISIWVLLVSSYRMLVGQNFQTQYSIIFNYYVTG